MALSEEDLRREALMRMAMPDMEVSPVSALDDEIYARNMKDRYNQEYGALQGQGLDIPTYEQFLGANKAPSSPAPTAPPKSKGYLDKAAEGLYDMLPGAAGTKAGLDPLLKRKGLGR